MHTEFSSKQMKLEKNLEKSPHYASTINTQVPSPSPQLACKGKLYIREMFHHMLIWTP